MTRIDEAQPRTLYTLKSMSDFSLRIMEQSGAENPIGHLFMAVAPWGAWAERPAIDGTNAWPKGRISMLDIETGYVWSGEVMEGSEFVLATPVHLLGEPMSGVDYSFDKVRDVLTVLLGTDPDTEVSSMNGDMLCMHSSKIRSDCAGHFLFGDGDDAPLPDIGHVDIDARAITGDEK